MSTVIENYMFRISFIKGGRRMQGCSFSPRSMAENGQACPMIKLTGRRVGANNNKTSDINEPCMDSTVSEGALICGPVNRLEEF